LMHSLAAIIGPAAGGTLYGINHDWPWIAGLVIAAAVLVGYQQLESRSSETCEHVEPTQPTGMPLAEVALEQPA
jgi:hypothetical protein